MAKLGEVCKVSPSTKNIERQGAWLLNLDMVEQQTGRVIEYKYVGEDDLNGSIIQFDTENVLYSKLRPNLNKVVLPPKDGFSTSELLPLRPDASVLNKDYLAAFLRSDSFVTWAVSKTAGAKMPRLGTKDLMNAEIPVPSIEQQKKIAEKFKKLEQLISLRKQQLAKLDELVKARFVEMFGNPSNNSLGFPYEPLSNCLLSIENGKSFVCSNDMRQEENPAILKLSAVTYGVYQQDENKAILDSSMFVKSAEVHKGDLLFTRKNTPELVGMCAYVNDTAPNLMMPDLIFRLNTNEKINKIFLWKLINHEFFRGKIQNIATGSAKSMSNISKERLEKLAIILPPLHLQNDFAALVERVDQQKQTIQQSLEKLELMKKALMQEYFG